MYSPTSLHDLPAGVEITTKSPLDLINDLEARGYKEIAICGGSQIYTMFMESGLVKKIYLTIEPIIFGSGIKLFQKEMDFKLKLINSEKTESGTMLLEYEVSMGN